MSIDLDDLEAKAKAATPELKDRLDWRQQAVDDQAYLDAVANPAAVLELLRRLRAAEAPKTSARLLTEFVAACIREGEDFGYMEGELYREFQRQGVKNP